MTSYVLTDGEETGYGYGLSIDEQGGQLRVHHGGADIAHRSQLVYYPDINAGITTQSNHAAFNSNVAFRLAGAFFADAIEPEGATSVDPSVFDPESYDVEDFDEFVGRYAIDAAPNFILSFFREGETLYTQATGQSRISIEPTSDSTFVIQQVSATILFHRNEDGEVDALTLNQGGEQRATRLVEDEDRWAPADDELRAFTGRYFSEELETFYEIHIEGDGIIARRRRIPDVDLSPGERDRFSGGDLNFTFERDRNGRVIGFYLDNVRTRDVRFERIGMLVAARSIGCAIVGPALLLLALLLLLASIVTASTSTCCTGTITIVQQPSHGLPPTGNDGVVKVSMQALDGPNALPVPQTR